MAGGRLVVDGALGRQPDLGRREARGRHLGARRQVGHRLAVAVALRLALSWALAVALAVALAEMREQAAVLGRPLGGRVRRRPGRRGRRGQGSHDVSHVQRAVAQRRGRLVRTVPAGKARAVAG